MNFLASLIGKFIKEIPYSSHLIGFLLSSLILFIKKENLSERSVHHSFKCTIFQHELASFNTIFHHLTNYDLKLTFHFRIRIYAFSPVESWSSGILVERNIDLLVYWYRVFFGSRSWSNLLIDRSELYETVNYAQYKWTLA
jgi:hypothetical protein